MPEEIDLLRSTTRLAVYAMPEEKTKDECKVEKGDE